MGGVQHVILENFQQIHNKGATKMVVRPRVPAGYVTVYGRVILF